MQAGDAMNLSPTATLIVTLLGVVLTLNAAFIVGFILLWRRKPQVAPAPFVVLDASDAIQARQVEQHDLITAGGVIEKNLAQAVAAHRPQAEIDALIAQKAQNAKDVHRVGVEVSTSFQSRNLTVFLDRMGEMNSEVVSGQKLILSEIGGLKQQGSLLQGNFHDLLESVNDFAERLKLVEESSQRKERNIAQLRDLLNSLSTELREVRARTAADAMTKEERYAMITTMRWLYANTNALALLLGVPPPLIEPAAEAE